MWVTIPQPKGDSMELPSLFVSLCLLLPFLLIHLSRCQQMYVDNKQLDCNADVGKTNGYLRNGPQSSCKAFVTFRSLPPYDTPVSIGYLLASDASNIASINNVSDFDKFPANKLVIVPVTCSSYQEFYQHDAPYTIPTDGLRSSITYFSIANDTYQGLTTCQALMNQNPYNYTSLRAGLELKVPVRCACPSRKQAEGGVSFLLTYMVTWADNISSISALASSMGEVYGVNLESILEANELSNSSLIYPFTPILVPLRSDSCTVRPENFFCSCPNGYRADGRKEGRICIPDKKGFPVKFATVLGVGIGFGVLCLVLLGFRIQNYLSKRKCRLRKEKLFKHNGGLLLQQKISSYRSGEVANIFSAEELQGATDSFNPSRVLGQGGFGTVYKGMLSNGTIVAIKRSNRAVDSSQIQQFINEVVILSQINHRNVVKLLGCCLETEAPLLVYEFIPKGTLSQHVHVQDPESSLSWECRLRVAAEVAGALSYMRSAASIPIFHRDIKSSNILLDDNYSAKVSDFGLSRPVPSDKTHLTTTIQGTFGYLDPEYFQSNQYTDKSDVYSFGVVLVELLTGERPISFSRAEKDANLVAYFNSSLKGGHLFQVLDPRVAKEATEEEVLVMAKLAKRCLRLNGKKRPTMKDVTMELDGLNKAHSDFGEDTRLLRGEASFLDIRSVSLEMEHLSAEEST